MARPKKKKILIIEDEPDQAYLVGAQLKLGGYETVSAADGQEGLRLAKEIQPALIVLDLRLPKLQGLEICRAIRDDRSKTYNRTRFSYTPIIMLTGITSDVDRVIGNVLGADHYFTKPFDATIFMKKVRQLLQEPEPSAAV